MQLGSYEIDDNLTFSCNTKRVDTGAAADADSAPTYRVYEDETGTPLLTGSMALLDDANTLGQYSEQIALTAANGFEQGKCYTIRLAATVNSVAGATTRQFQVGAKVNVTRVAGTAQTAGDIIGDTNDIQTRLPAALVGGRMDSSTGAMAAGVLTATAIADGAFTAAKAAAGFFDAVWSVATRTLTAFSTSLAVSVWDVLTSAVAAANSIGLQIKTNLDVVLSTRASQASVDAIDDFLDTEIAAILAAVDTEIATILTRLGVPASDIATAVDRLTALRAGYLDNLSAGAVALDSTVAKTALFTTTTRNDPAALAAALASGLTPLEKLDWLLAFIARGGDFNKTTGERIVYNSSDTPIAKMTCSDDGTTTERGQPGPP